MTEPLPEITFIEREEADGSIGGSLYGSSVRVIARSPTHIVFSGAGSLHAVERARINSWHGHTRLVDGRISTATLTAAKAKADAFLGPGSGDAMLEAWKRKGTVLFDGGGEKLPGTRVYLRKIAQDAYDATGVEWKAALTGKIATCKQCGANLKPATNHHRLGYTELPDHPRTLEDCQRKANQQIVAIHGYGLRKDRLGLIAWFEVWDGESTEQEDFCHDKCAAIYGRRAAQELPLVLKIGGQPLKKAYVPRDDVDHAPAKEAVIHELSDGSTIRL